MVAVVIAIISSIRISASAFTGSLTEAKQRSLLSKGCLTYWYIVLVCIDSLGKYIHKTANQNHTL